MDRWDQISETVQHLENNCSDSELEFELRAQEVKHFEKKKRDFETRGIPTGIEINGVLDKP